jgi:hypothetical protein
VAVRFASSSRVKNDLPRYSNFWDGTTIYSPFTATGSYDALASYTVPAGGVSSITFSGIPTGGQYAHLQIRGIAQTNRGTFGRDLVNLQLNNDTGANYSWHVLNGDGSSAGAGGSTSTNEIRTGATGTTTAGSGFFGAQVVDILDYANTSKFKTVRNLGGNDVNGTVGGAGGEVILTSGSWRNTNAVTSLTFYPAVGSTFSQYTQFALYGIRG